MDPTPTPAAPTPIEAVALDFARRFAMIVVMLVGVVARRFLRHPRFGSVTIQLGIRLNRFARRITSLMARVAANRLPKPRPPRPGRVRRDTPAQPPAFPPVRFPTSRGWLVQAIGHEAAAATGQLEFLLREPGVPELLAAVPAIGRILRPFAHMLGVQSPALPPLPRKPRAPRRRADPEPPRADPPRPPLPQLPPGHPCAGYRPSANWPRGCMPNHKRA
jgi:hypothetical protein